MNRIFATLIAALLALCLGAGGAFAKDEKAATEKAKAPAAAAAQVDLNSATAAELAALPGIGDVRAKAIIDHRPYHGKDELVQKKVITEGVYRKIKDMVIAKQAK